MADQTTNTIRPSAEKVAELTEDAINAIALIVQNALGITDGGPASMFYSDAEQRMAVRDCVQAYIDFELSPAGSCPIAEEASEKLSWLACKDLKHGDRVVFIDDWDIFPEALVKAGTVCTVEANGLADAQAGFHLSLYPDDKAVRAALHEWDGHIHLGDDLNREVEPTTDPEWLAAAPIAKLEVR